MVFEGGQAYADAGGGRLERLHSRKQGGETIYYRMVRYDNEFGYSCQVVRVMEDMAGVNPPAFPR